MPYRFWPPEGDIDSECAQRTTDQRESGVFPGVGSVPLGGGHTGQGVRSHLQGEKHSSHFLFQLHSPLGRRKNAARNQTLRGLTRESILPSSMSAISCLIPSRASQKRSISALSSDSVGSIIRVPATGQDMVGAWKPAPGPARRKHHRSDFFPHLKRTI